VVRIRGIQGKWRESDMEYVQELESLKKEINKSGRRIENLSGIMENFANLDSLRETIKSFQEDNIFSRIESKIDIIAQADSTEIVALIINELSEDISQKHNTLSERINSLEELNEQVIEFLKEKSGQTTVNSEQKSEDLAEIKENIEEISSNYSHFLENLNSIQKLMLDFKSGEYQTGNMEEFASNLKTSLASVDKQEFFGLEHKLDSLINLLKDQENTFSGNLSELDAKISNINEHLTSFNNLEDNFDSVREKLATMEEVLKNSGLENLERISGFNLDVSEMESRINSEISGNLGLLKEAMYKLYDETGKISHTLEQRGSDEELREKINYLISIIYELREETDSGSRILYDENIDQVLESVQSMPKTEFVSEKLANINNLFNQIKVRLDDESIEQEIKQGFSTVEENFERIEDILANISAFEDIKEETSTLNQKITQIQEQVNDKSEIKQILNNLANINNDITAVNEKLPEKTIYTELKEGFSALSRKVFEVYENLYPLQNLQRVNEGFESAQEKLNLIIENLNNNDIENLQKALDLGPKFGGIHSDIETKVVSILNILKDQLTEALEKAEQITSDLQSGNETGEQIKGDVKYLNLKADSLKDLLDRIIRFNGNNSEKTENNFEEIKNTLSYLNNEILHVKNTTNQGLSTDRFIESVETISSKLEHLREKAEDRTSVNELKDFLASIQEEINSLRASNLSTEDFNNTAEDFNNKLASLKEHVSDKTDAEQVKSLINSLQEDINFLKVSGLSADDFNSRANDLNNRLEYLREKAEDQTSVNELKDFLASIQEEIHFLRETSLNTEDFKNSAEDLNDKLNILQAQIDDKTDANHVKDLLGSIKREICSLRRSADETVNIQDFRESIDALIRKTDKNINIENFNQSIEPLISRLDYLKEKTNDETAVNELKSYLNSIKTEISSLSKTAEDRVKADQFSEAVCFLNEKVNSLSERIGYNPEFDELKDILASLKREIDSVRRTAEQGVRSERFTESANFINDKLEHLQEKVEDETGLNELKDSLGSIQKELSSLKEINFNTEKFNDTAENLNNKLDSLQGQVSDKTDANQLRALLSSIQEEINSLRNSNINAEEFRDSTEFLSNKLDFLRDRINDDTKISELKGLLGSIQQDILAVNRKVDENDIEEELKDRLYDLQNLGTLNESFQSAQDKLNLLVNSINDYSPEFLREELDLENKFNNLHFQIDNQVITGLSSIKECLNELQDKQTDPEEIKNALHFFKHNLEEISENLKYGTQNNITEEILQNLLEDVNSTKELINNSPTNLKIDEVNARITDIDQKISTLQETTQFKESIDFIKDNICQLEEKFNYTNEKISDFTGFIKNNADKDNVAVNEQLESINKNLETKIEHNAKVLNVFLNEFSEKVKNLQDREDIDSLKEGLSRLSSSFVNISGDISGLCEEVHSLKDIQEKVENINNQLQFASSYEEIRELNSKIDFLTEEISVYKESLSQIQQDIAAPDYTEVLSRIDKVNSEIKSGFESQNLEEIISEVSEIKKAVNKQSEEQDFAGLNSKIEEINNNLRVQAKYQDFAKILSKIQEIKDTLDNQPENNDSEKLDSIEEKVSNKFGSLNDNIAEVKNKIESLNDSLSGLKEENNSEAIQHKLESGLGEIKELSSQVSGEVSTLKNVMCDLFDAIGGMDEGNEDFQRERLDEAVNRIENIINGTRPEFDELKSSSYNLTEKLDGLSSNFLGISEETRDKLDKLFDLSRDLESKIGDSSLNTDEILDSLKNISETSQNQFSATNDTLDSLKHEFSSIGEELNGFDAELTDISSKINKLILSSNDNTGALKEKINKSFDHLKEDIKKELENNAANMNQSSQNQMAELSGNLTEIQRRIDNVNSVSVKGLNSTDTLKEAIIQMAEWLDSAGKLLEENNEYTKQNLINVDNIIKTVSDSKQTVAGQVDKICKKFENFEVRLESIEAKVEKAASNKDNNNEIKQLLLDVQEKIPSSNGKENGQVLDKIDKLETQMVLFETKIQKVLEFIEHEEV